MNDDKGIGCAVFFAIALWIAAFIGGCSVGERYMKAEAIKSGVAEWQIDAKTGHKRFVFLKPETPDDEPKPVE